LIEVVEEARRVTGSTWGNSVPSIDFGLAGVDILLRHIGRGNIHRSGRIQKVAFAVAAAIIFLAAIGLIQVVDLAVSNGVAILADNGSACSSHQKHSEDRGCSVAGAIGVDISALERGVANPSIRNTSGVNSASTPVIQTVATGILRSIGFDAVLNASVARCGSTII